MSESRNEQIHDFGLDFDCAEVYLNGEGMVENEEPGVDYRMASTFIKNMNILKKTEQPVTIHMNTIGGDWQYGMAIYDCIKQYPFKTTIINYSWARSMSSIILQAATERIMMPHSCFMAHLGTGFYEGHYLTAQAAAAFDKKTEDVMFRIYAERMRYSKRFAGFDTPTIMEYVKNQVLKNGDWWLTAEETVNFGLADKVI